MWLRSLENRSISWDGKTLDPGIWLSDAKYASEIEQFARDFSVLFPPDDSGVDCGECVAPREGRRLAGRECFRGWG